MKYTVILILMVLGLWCILAALHANANGSDSQFNLKNLCLTFSLSAKML
jgi:hypothetical protein